MKRLGSLTEKWWKLLAVVIIVVAAGPEAFVYAEGMAILEVLGAATFVFMYVVGAKMYWHNLWNWFTDFENRYHFFLPSFSLIRETPGLLFYAIPRRSALYAVFVFLGLTSFSSVWTVLS